MGKNQQRLKSYEIQGKLDYEKYGQRMIRGPRPCSLEAAYMRGYARAKYGYMAVLGRHKDR